MDVITLSVYYAYISVVVDGTRQSEWNRVIVRTRYWDLRREIMKRQQHNIMHGNMVTGNDRRYRRTGMRNRRALCRFEIRTTDAVMRSAPAA